MRHGGAGVGDVEELVGKLRYMLPRHADLPHGTQEASRVSILAAAQLPPGSVQGVIMHSVPFVYLYPSFLGSFAGNYILRVPLRYARFSSASGLSHDDLSFSSDYEGLHDWLGSPLRVKMRGEFLSECFDLGAAARASLPRIHVPVLIQVGCQDSLADKASRPECAVQRLTQAMKHAKATVHCYSDSGPSSPAWGWLREGHCQ